MKKFNVGIIGATGMVGQRFALLLCDHPWKLYPSYSADSASRGELAMMPGSYKKSP